jgi:hypothetical protein
MALVDFDKLAKEYANVSDDFGLSFVSKQEYESKITKAVEQAEDYASAMTADEYKARLKELESMIVPFLTKLHQTGDKEYIYWPNRQEAIEKHIEKILKLTRG